MICVLFCFAALPSVGWSKSEEDQKTRAMIISAMTAPELTAFYALMGETNPNIDTEFRPPTINDADAIAYFLTSWSDAPFAPGAQEMPEIFELADSAESPNVSLSITASFDDGRQLRFYFYSLSDSGFAPLACYAPHLATEITRNPGEEFENNYLQDCIN